MVDVHSVAAAERESVGQNVDDVFFWARSVGTLGLERVEVAVDGGQLDFDGFSLADDISVLLVQGCEGAFYLLGFHDNQLLLPQKQASDLHVFKGTVADGVDGRGHKRIAHLPKELGGGYHYGDC